MLAGCFFVGRLVELAGCGVGFGELLRDEDEADGLAARYEAILKNIESQMEVQS
jgi:hypothetical protein